MSNNNATKAQFNWQDPFLIEQQLTEEERMVRETAYGYCQDNLLPRVLEQFRHEKTDATIFREMGELGLLGPTIPESYGGSGLNYVSYGLIAREIERVDSGYRSMASVQSSLVMVPINEFGTEAQKQKYLPKLATGEYIGYVDSDDYIMPDMYEKLDLSSKQDRKLLREMDEEDNEDGSNGQA